MLPIKRIFPSILFLITALASPALSQTGTFTTMSMASYGPLVSPDSIAAGFGTNLATASTTGAPPLLTTLGGASVSLTDSAGTKVAAPLYLVSSGQINYLIPASTAIGKATVTVTTASGTSQGTLLISNVAPAFATANADGKGAPAAQVVRITSAGASTVVLTFTGSAGTYTASSINLSTATDRVYLMLYGTGIRRHSLNPVIATIGGVRVPVLYAGAQSQFPGLDQVNIGPLPQTLAGKGAVTLALTVDGVPANAVALNFQ